MDVGQGSVLDWGYFNVLFFLYIKSSCVFLFAVFLMEKGNKKLIKKKKEFGIKAFCINQKIKK